MISTINCVTNNGQKYIVQRGATVSALEINLGSFVCSTLFCFLNARVVVFFLYLKLCLLKHVKNFLNGIYTTIWLRFAYVPPRCTNSKLVRSELMRYYHTYFWNVLNQLITNS